MDGPPTIDFETEAIQDGTGIPPKPVGVALWIPGQEPEYLAWGHPSGNNCDEGHAKNRVARVWNECPLFHNGRFDMGVAVEHWDFKVPDEHHDTMFQIYLHNPLARTVSLKPSAHTILGMPPDEQDAVKDYVMAHGFTKKPTEAGAYISKCPAELISPYAIGDVVRTRKMHDHLYQEVINMKWEDAYHRELRLSPLLMKAERRGVRVNRHLLQHDYNFYTVIFDQVTDILCARLGDINLNAGAEVARALIAKGFAKESDFRRTPTGRISTAKDSLEGAIGDKLLLQLIRYRGSLKTLLGTFMGPWLAMSEFDGHLHPSWNQVKGDDYGTRTGRLSCSNPNLQNVPTEFEGLEIWGLPPLPFMRKYLLPDEGEILVAADYNGQEMRLLAHFAEGRAAEIYRDNPRADFHEIARLILENEAGLYFKRKHVKIVGFSLIYGAGVNNLAGQTGLPYAEAKKLRNHYLKSIPGLDEFIDDCSSRPGIRTWGGRWIPMESPQYQYRLPNHLIQGSAADQEKQSIIEYHKANPTGRFLMTVHDENVISSKPEDLAENVEKLKYAMESLPNLDVPFVAEVEVGQNWHELKAYQ